MSSQALNSAHLYYMGNPSTIEQLLRMQSSSIVDELYDACHLKKNQPLSSLAVALSLGMAFK